MPQAVSKAQQRFFSLVKAVQKGDVPANKVTSNVRQAAKDASPEDVDDIATKDTTGLPDRAPNADPESKEDTEKKVDDSMNYGPQNEESGINFYEIVAKYNEYGKILSSEHTLSELGQQLSSIAEYAEHTLTNEMDDWFDKHTVSRNIKEMRSYAKEFQKIAAEADSHNMRMKALYDDMGRVLERYFDIMDSDSDSDSGEEATPEEDLGQRNNMNTWKPNESAPVATQPTPAPAPKVEATPAPAAQSAPSKTYEQQMFERIVRLARHKLRGENLVKFDTLPESTQVKLAWRIIK